MPSLLDITPLSRTITLGGGQAIVVRGLSARQMAGLMARFPELQMMMGGRFDDLTADEMRKLVPDAMAAIIASSADLTEETADSLAGADAFALLSAVIEMSLPPGIAGPFAQALGVPNGPAVALFTEEAGTK